MKSQIVEELGQTDVLLPVRIAEGLAANDRVKTRLSLLQEAARRARAPAAQKVSLTEECRAVGLDPVAMDALLDGARAAADDHLAAPGLAGLGAGVWSDVAAMAAAVAAGDEAAGTTAQARLAALTAASPLGGSDLLPLAEVAAVTGLPGPGADSVHRLVMDLHKALNALAAAHAEEEVAGARAYGLKAEDRPAVEAFMRGLAATRPLKFDHPGLATLASRNGARLTIQNDIGETDAHVVVIQVEGDGVTVTYSDVHRARAKFFVGGFEAFPVDWSGLDGKRAEGLAEGEMFYLVTGRLTDPDPARRSAFLEALGASLVFLIDWNKARKVLRNLVSKADAVRILAWAARNRVGHRGFLELGGADLVAAAVQHAAPGRIGFGARLDAVLGREAAVAFLEAVLRIATEALLNGASARLARDRIEAELVGRLERVETELLAVVVRQSGIAREIAAGIAHLLMSRAGGRSADHPADKARLTERARVLEQKADRIALDARNEIARLDVDRTLERLVDRVEQAIDELEQAAFIASLVPLALDAEVAAALGRLARLGVEGAEAAAKGAAAASEIPEGSRVDSEDALSAAGRLIEIEHAADTEERAVTTLVLRGAHELNVALSVLELTRALERATDQFASVGHLLRARVLADLTR